MKCCLICTHRPQVSWAFASTQIFNVTKGYFRLQNISKCFIYIYEIHNLNCDWHLSIKVCLHENCLSIERAQKLFDPVKYWTICVDAYKFHSKLKWNELKMYMKLANDDCLTPFQLNFDENTTTKKNGIVKFWSI